MKNKFVELIERSQLKSNLPNFNPGDFIIVNLWIKEGDKQRIQAFKGFVIKKKNKYLQCSFTVRKISYGVGVERTFQINSPLIDSIVVDKKAARIHKAKLYYMRSLRGKAARIKEKV